MKKIQLAIPFFALILLIPPGVLAQQTNEMGTDGTIDNPHILSPDDKIGPVGRADDLHAAHSTLTEIMQQQSLGNFDTPDYPFVMTFVDEEKGDLVVMMHAMAAMANIEYEEEEIAIALNTDVHIDIRYGIFILEVSQSRIESWKQYYVDNCSPVKPGYKAVCQLFGNNLKENGIDPTKLKKTTSTTTPKPTLKTTSPCDESPSSLACYYYKKYQEKCLPTKTVSRCNTYATQLKNAGYDVPTSKAPTIVKVTPPKVTNVKAVISGDDIKITWDKPAYDVKRYRVYVYEDNKYKDREYITTNSYTFDEVKKGKDYKFRVYVYYENNAKLKSIHGGYVWSNVVSVPDTKTPVTPKPAPTPKPTPKPTSTSIIPEAFAIIAAYAGSPMGYIPYLNSSSDDMGAGVISAVVTDSKGKHGIVVSRHVITHSTTVIDEEKVHLLRHIHGDTFKSLAKFGNITHPQLPSQHLTDASFVLSNDKIELIPDQVLTKSGILNITSYNSTMLVENQSPIRLIGLKHDVKGHVLNMNVTVRTNDIGTLQKQILANYPSVGGDSGGPVIFNNNTMVGAHVGKICEFRLSTISTNYSFGQVCNPKTGLPVNNQIPVFTPWENISKELNLQ